MEQLSFANALPTGLEIEVAALRDHVALSSSPDYATNTADMIEVRKAVQLCSVGLADISVSPGGDETSAASVVAALDLEPFVERRIRGWAGLN